MIKLDGITGMYNTKVIDVNGKTIPVSTPQTVNVAGQEGTQQAAIPERVTETVTGIPVIEGMKTYWDFWQVLLGSPEGKLEHTLPYYPIPEQQTTDIMENLDLGIQKLTPEQQEMWKTPVIQGTDITLPKFEWPDLSGIGKWLLIGGGVIAALYLAGRYLGRKK